MLDLSFNRIRKIQGLESLVKLRKLFLVSNKIEKIENISHLKELEMLELGDNKIRVCNYCFLVRASLIPVNCAGD